MPSVRHHPLFHVLEAKVSPSEVSAMLRLTQAQVEDLRKSCAASPEAGVAARSPFVPLASGITLITWVFGGKIVEYPGVPTGVWFYVTAVLLTAGLLWGMWRGSRLDARAQLVLDAGRQLDPLAERPEWCVRLVPEVAATPAASAYRDAVVQSGRELLVRDGLFLDALVKAQKEQTVEAAQAQALAQLMTPTSAALS